MKKSPVHIGAGNVNMRGKKTHMMGCRCCVCYDFRDEVRKKEHQKEINDHVAQLNRASP